MLVLLPPSEGKTAPARGPALDLADLHHASLTEPRRRVLESLVGLCRTDPERAGQVLGLGPTQRHLVERDAALLEAPTARAERVYSGVLYDALGLPALDPAARRRAARRVRVVSALFGLLAPADRIPAYRLSGATTLPGVGSLATAWRQHLGPAVDDVLGRGLLVDLRSAAYAALWRPPREIAARTVTVRVLRESAGSRTVVSHLNKATKGRLTGGLLTHGADPPTPAALVEVWRDLGWVVEPTTTSAGTRVEVVVGET